jgi:hypothetical protein
MKIFISWSGTRSHAVAEALRDWLPCVITSIQPWISSADIEKGAQWSSEIATALKESQVGIICLTPENLNAPWLLFESGALSKSIEATRVCTYLYEMTATGVGQPLAQFQATQATQQDTFKLLNTINRGLGEGKLEDARLEKIFARWWPDLEATLTKIPPYVTTDASKVIPVRSERDILEEILGFLRSQDRRFSAMEEIPDVDVSSYMDSLQTALRAARKSDAGG